MLSGLPVSGHLPMFSTKNPKALRMQHISLAWIALALFYSANIICGHQLNPEESHSDYILCRQCGADIADASYIFNHFSPTSTIKGNQTLFKRKNIGIQIVKNEIGTEIQIVTVRKANCVGVGDWQPGNTWYPGYAWKACICSACGHHLGRIFEPLSTVVQSQKTPSAEGFYAFMLDSTISESFSDSLVIIPKSYRG